MVVLKQAEIALTAFVLHKNVKKGGPVKIGEISLSFVTFVPTGFSFFALFLFLLLNVMAQIPDDVAVALAAVTQDGPDMQSNTAKTVVQHHATVLNNEIKQEVSIVPEVIQVSFLISACIWTS